MPPPPTDKLLDPPRGGGKSKGPPGSRSAEGWHHTLGETMIIGGVFGMLIAGIGALRRGHGRR